MLEANKPEYNFILRTIESAILMTAKLRYGEIPRKVIGIIFDKKYQDIATICDSELNLFQSFDLTIYVETLPRGIPSRLILG